jgi:plastocyanin
MKLRPRAGRSVLVVICALAAAATGAAAAFGALHRTAVEPVTETVSAGQSPIGLHGVDGPGFTITFAYSDNNQTVNFLNPGTYRITIDDLSNIHNFHLTGSATDVATDVAAVGTTVWNVTLQPGTYTFVCDPHASQMNGQLLVLPYSTVTSFPAPPPQPKHHKKKH